MCNQQCDFTGKSLLAVYPLKQENVNRNSPILKIMVYTTKYYVEKAVKQVMFTITALADSYSSVATSTGVSASGRVSFFTQLKEFTLKIATKHFNI